MFKFVDCFSGAGGLGLGLKQAGFEPIYSFDIDEKSIESHRLNSKYFNHTSEVYDIRDLLNNQLLKKLKIKKGELDLLAGGPPCQGFSVQRIGKDEDDRNNLVMVYFELIKEVMPKFFLLENVQGLQGKRGQHILEEFKELSRELGYFLHHRLIDAQEYGVPQRRKRVILVGERDVYTEELSSFTFPKANKNKVVTVRDAISHLPTPPQDGKDHPNHSLHRRDRLSETNKNRLRALKSGQGRESLPKDLVANCHKRSAKDIGHRGVYGRMDWDDVAPTITARFDSFTRGQFGHPSQIRSISLREGAILQSFPEDFEFYGSKVEIARQIGNAVPPILAKKLGKCLIKALNNKNEFKMEVSSEHSAQLI